MKNRNGQKPKGFVPGKGSSTAVVASPTKSGGNKDTKVRPRRDGKNG